MNMAMQLPVQRENPGGGPLTGGAPELRGEPPAENKLAEGLLSVLAHAGKAIDLSVVHRTPPRPAVYSVWYNYITGENNDAKLRVRELLHGGAAISAYDLEQIHSQYLASDAVRQSFIDQANARLEMELADVLKAVEAHIVSSDDYCGSLWRNARGLEAHPGVDTIRALIETLVIENAAMRANTQKLGASLEQSKSQINALYAALVESRMTAVTDPLTGIANRRGFQERLKQEIERCKPGRERFCLILADIDHFKRINDTFGHAIGDEVLRYFAGLLAQNLEPAGYSARYGGEEFAIILPGNGHAEASKKADILREQFSAVRLVVAESKEQIGVVTASFGVAEHVPGEAFESLIHRADIRLYKAKAGGRNCVR
jgi:diguanylate cyclase